jgi:hypothetical protein
MDQTKNPIEQVPKPKLSLDDLPKVVEFLRSIGLQPWQYFEHASMEQIKDELRNQGNTIPLVMEGTNGIRASYEAYEDRFAVWFTNGFDDPQNETRRKIEAWLSENFDLSR